MFRTRYNNGVWSRKRRRLILGLSSGSNALATRLQVEQERLQRINYAHAYSEYVLILAQHQCLTSGRAALVRHQQASNQRSSPLQPVSERSRARNAHKSPDPARPALSSTSMANQYRTLTRDIAASLRSQNVDAAAAGVALDAFAAALPDGKLKASLGEPGSEQRAAVVEAVEAHLAEEDDGDDLGADDDTLSALASDRRRGGLREGRRGARQVLQRRRANLGDAEIPLLDRSDGDGVAAAAQACVAALCASVQLLEDDVGDESDWRAGALAGCYAALLAQTSGAPKRPSTCSTCSDLEEKVGTSAASPRRWPRMPRTPTPR